MGPRHLSLRLQWDLARSCLSIIKAIAWWAVARLPCRSLGGGTPDRIVTLAGMPLLEMDATAPQVGRSTIHATSKSLRRDGPIAGAPRGFGGMKAELGQKLGWCSRPSLSVALLLCIGMQS
jgi:hypothetical protein